MTRLQVRKFVKFFLRNFYGIDEKNNLMVFVSDVLRRFCLSQKFVEPSTKSFGGCFVSTTIKSKRNFYDEVFSDFFIIFNAREVEKQI